MLQRFFLVLAVLLATVLWGCQSGQEKRIAEDPCTASGGIRVGDKCYSRSEDTPKDWSQQTIQEMQRGFEERQPGGGRLR
jgi:hypothetical protein